MCECLTWEVRPLLLHAIVTPASPRAADEFPRKKERSDGLDSYCKACNAAATAERTARKGPVLAPLVASKVDYTIALVDPELIALW